MSKLIELVCTGNRGRSPVAELIAKNYLREVGALNDYEVISSGTLVSKIRDCDFPISAMLPIIKTARKREIYDFESLRKLDYAIRMKNRPIVERYFNKATTYFSQEEEKHRTQFMNELGITGCVKESQDQTIARQDTIAVLSVDHENNARVLSIYASSNNSPIISVLSVFATGQPNAEIPNAFGLGKHKYFIALDRVIDEVPKAVRKIIGA